jgi:trimeric autotransporter adhesin
MLLDGTILNADINASAAIAGSKIVAATTGVVGAVQLSDSTSTTSSVLAATPTAVKAAYDLADAALPKAGGTLTGNVILDNQVDARFREATANGTNYVGFQAPASVAADVLWTLPAADGTSNQVLTTNGSGTLSFSTPATGVSLGLVIALS